MGMAWCRVSSLTAAASRSLLGANLPLPRSRILLMVNGKKPGGMGPSQFPREGEQEKELP